MGLNEAELWFVNDLLDYIYFISPSTVGSHRLISGTKATSNKPNSMVKNMGNNGLITAWIFNLATLQPTNSTEPTGGVHKPMHRLSTIIIPKCTGSMPVATTTGKNMGVNISTAGVISMNIPTHSKITLIMSKMIIGLSLMVNKICVIVCGIFS